ncbi:forespore capture DNA-binding protein RefZ [Melghiribacillus thermohalophilus]|uniref:forespore capture DNA-binding protein RefZ n=1 Tax=Melghiribacillus thermohalophilus TaxID=1324956 RepID=UPI001FB33705|nr:forespore capture DNA-binding protein RefZ [Melghiribacillus thermohalophilus]
MSLYLEQFVKEKPVRKRNMITEKGVIPLKEHSTKQKVQHAARELFYLKGFHGTSLRDIAKKANVNVSLISYYFDHKQGLLEALMIQYYEHYLREIEEVQQQYKGKNPVEAIVRLVEAIIHYKQKNHQFTCFIQRELTLDNMLVREMLVTYLARERYVIENAFLDLLESQPYNQMEKKCLLVQFKGMLNSPYFMPHEWLDYVRWDGSHQSFVNHYTKVIRRWLESLYVA